MLLRPRRLSGLISIPTLRRVLCLGCVLIAAPVRIASAEPDTDVVHESARALADEGVNAYAAHDYERALSLFQRAHMLVPAPTIVLFEARTLDRLGQLLDARKAYWRLIRSELRADAPAPFRNAVETGRTELAALDARIPRLYVVLAGNPETAERVLLDDRPLPVSMLRGPLLIDPGAHSLALRTSRGAAAPTHFVVAEGQTEHVTLELPRPSGPDPQRTWSFVALGVGGAALTLGIAAGAVSLAARDEAEQSCPEHRCVAGSSGADAVDRFRSWRTVSTAGYVVGAVGLGAGVALLFTSRSDQGTTLAVTPTVGGGRMVATW